MLNKKALAAGVKLANEIGLINIDRKNMCVALDIPYAAFPTVVGGSYDEFILSLRDLVGSGASMPALKSRANPEIRKEHLLDVALELAEKVGFDKITRSMLAEAAGVSNGLISLRFGTMEQLKNDTMRRAVKTKCLKVIAQGLAKNNRHACRVDQATKQEALKCLM